MGDYGGFGVGSDYQWQATGLLGYNFHFLGDDNARVIAGYRAVRLRRVFAKYYRPNPGDVGSSKLVF